VARGLDGPTVQRADSRAGLKARPAVADHCFVMVIVLRRRAPLGLCLLLSLALFGCASRPSEIALAIPARATPVEIAGHDAMLTMLARPSAEVARLAHADRYRVLFEGPSAITLVLLDEFDRPHARIRLRPIDHARASAGWSVDFEDFDVGVEGRIEQWTLAGRLHGNATIGHRSASWRARFEADGQLSAERWKIEHDEDPRATTAIRRARAIGHDLGSLTTELDATLTSEHSCQLVEALAQVDLALDLALRAYEGRGRTEMPVWTSSLAESCG
jgi:hypothetical protein